MYRHLVVAVSLMALAFTAAPTAQATSAPCTVTYWSHIGFMGYTIALSCPGQSQLRIRWTVTNEYGTNVNEWRTEYPNGVFPMGLFAYGTISACALEITLGWESTEYLPVDLSTTGIPCTSPNTAPTIDAGSDLERLPRSTIMIAATYADPDAGDTHTATVDWDDGQGPREARASDGVIVAETSLHAGAHEVAICVTDAAGETACDTLSLRVGGAGGKPTPEMHPGQGHAKGLAK